MDHQHTSPSIPPPTHSGADPIPSTVVKRSTLTASGANTAVGASSADQQQLFNKSTNLSVSGLCDPSASTNSALVRERKGLANDLVTAAIGATRDVNISYDDNTANNRSVNKSATTASVNGTAPTGTEVVGVAEDDITQHGDDDEATHNADDDVHNTETVEHVALTKEVVEVAGGGGGKDTSDGAHGEEEAPPIIAEPSAAAAAGSNAPKAVLTEGEAALKIQQAYKRHHQHRQGEENQTKEGHGGNTDHRGEEGEEEAEQKEGADISGAENSATHHRTVAEEEALNDTLAMTPEHQNQPEGHHGPVADVPHPQQDALAWSDPDVDDVPPEAGEAALLRQEEAEKEEEAPSASIDISVVAEEKEASIAPPIVVVEDSTHQPPPREEETVSQAVPLSPSPPPPQQQQRKNVFIKALDGHRLGEERIGNNGSTHHRSPVITGGGVSGEHRRRSFEEEGAPSSSSPTPSSLTAAHQSRQQDHPYDEALDIATYDVAANPPPLPRTARVAWVDELIAHLAASEGDASSPLVPNFGGSKRIADDAQQIIRYIRKYFRLITYASTSSSSSSEVEWQLPLTVIRDVALAAPNAELSALVNTIDLLERGKDAAINGVTNAHLRPHPSRRFLGIGLIAVSLAMITAGQRRIRVQTEVDFASSANPTATTAAGGAAAAAEEQLASYRAMLSTADPSLCVKVAKLFCYTLTRVTSGLGEVVRRHGGGTKRATAAAAGNGHHNLLRRPNATRNLFAIGDVTRLRLSSAAMGAFIASAEATGDAPLPSPFAPATVSILPFAATAMRPFIVPNKKEITTTTTTLQRQHNQALAVMSSPDRLLTSRAEAVFGHLVASQLSPPFQRALLRSCSLTAANVGNAARDVLAMLAHYAEGSAEGFTGGKKEDSNTEVNGAREGEEKKKDGGIVGCGGALLTTSIAARMAARRASSALGGGGGGRIDGGGAATAPIPTVAMLRADAAATAHHHSGAADQKIVKEQQPQQSTEPPCSLADALKAVAAYDTTGLVGPNTLPYSSYTLFSFALCFLLAHQEMVEEALPTLYTKVKAALARAMGALQPTSRYSTRRRGGGGDVDVTDMLATTQSAFGLSISLSPLRSGRAAANGTDLNSTTVVMNASLNTTTATMSNTMGAATMYAATTNSTETNAALFGTIFDCFAELLQSKAFGELLSHGDVVTAEATKGGEQEGSDSDGGGHQPPSSSGGGGGGEYYCRWLSVSAAVVPLATFYASEKYLVPTDVSSSAAAATGSDDDPTTRMRGLGADGAAPPPSPIHCQRLQRLLSACRVYLAAVADRCALFLSPCGAVQSSRIGAMEAFDRLTSLMRSVGGECGQWAPIVKQRRTVVMDSTTTATSATGARASLPSSSAPHRQQQEVVCPQTWALLLAIIGQVEMDKHHNHCITTGVEGKEEEEQLPLRPVPPEADPSPSRARRLFSQ